MTDPPRNSRRATRRRRLLAAALAAAGLSAALFLQIGNLLVVASPIGAPEAIVSLGSHEWERLPLAARLARTSPDAVLLLTRPVRVTEKNCYQCNERVEWLVQAGVARERIVVLQQPSRNTHDEAAATASYAATRGVRSVLVVTSPYHGRRALATFRQAFAGSPVRVGIDIALRESGVRPSRWWRNAAERWYVAYESAALVWYALRYGVTPFGG